MASTSVCIRCPLEILSGAAPMLHICCMHVCVRAWCVCVCVCLSTCVCVCTYVLYVSEAAPTLHSCQMCVCVYVRACVHACVLYVCTCPDMYEYHGELCPCSTAVVYACVCVCLICVVCMKCFHKLHPCSELSCVFVCTYACEWDTMRRCAHAPQMLCVYVCVSVHICTVYMR